MSPSPRLFALIALFACAGLTAGCGSNNKGKIEGKWKVTKYPEKTDAKTKASMEEMAKQGVYMYLEFKTDATVSVGIGSDKQEVLEFIKAMAPNNKISWDMKYKLSSGNYVEVYDMPKDMQTGGGGLFGNKDKARVSIKIAGNDMTLLDDEGTTQLTRIK